MSTGDDLTMEDMRVGVLDVGSNTVRLLVANVGDGGVRTLHEERAQLGLGEEILRHGTVRRRKLRELEGVAREFAATAHHLRVRVLETVVTAPGRQVDEPGLLVERLAQATGAGVRIVSAEEEGRLAFAGAVAHADLRDQVVAVCDVGGGSTEIVVGTPLVGPAWVRSVDVGSLRLTTAFLRDDPPAADQVAAAREHVDAALASLVPPRPALALATGGSARCIARVIGHDYGPEDLDRLARELAARPSARSALLLGIPSHRARTLLAGALVLARVSGLLGLPFKPAGAGIREGVALELRAARRAA